MMKKSIEDLIEKWERNLKALVNMYDDNMHGVTWGHITQLGCDINDLKEILEGK